MSARVSRSKREEGSRSTVADGWPWATGDDAARSACAPSACASASVQSAGSSRTPSAEESAAAESRAGEAPSKALLQLLAWWWAGQAAAELGAAPSIWMGVSDRLSATVSGVLGAELHSTAPSAPPVSSGAHAAWRRLSMVRSTSTKGGRYSSVLCQHARSRADSAADADGGTCGRASWSATANAAWTGSSDSNGGSSV
eukprot:7389151-Prymnesium_polylepis.1